MYSLTYIYLYILHNTIYFVLAPLQNKLKKKEIYIYNVYNINPYIYIYYKCLLKAMYS